MGLGCGGARGKIRLGRCDSCGGRLVQRVIDVGKWERSGKQDTE